MGAEQRHVTAGAAVASLPLMCLAQASPSLRGTSRGTLCESWCRRLPAAERSHPCVQVRCRSEKGLFQWGSPHTLLIAPPLLIFPGCAVAARDRREAPLHRPASGSRRRRACRRDAPRHRAVQPRLVGRARVRVSRRAGRGTRVRPCAFVWRPRVRAQCDRRASGDRDCDARLVRPLGAGARGPSLSVQFWLQQ